MTPNSGETGVSEHVREVARIGGLYDHEKRMLNGAADRLDVLEALVREAMPDEMGGYPDLFAPPLGWEDWNRRARAVLG